MSRSHAGSLLLLLGLAVCWGYNWVVMKIGLHDSGPVAFAAIRCLGGAVILGCVLLVLRRSFRIVEPVTVAVIGLLQTSAAQGLIAMALHGGQAGKSAVLNYTLPVWVMILGFLFLKERPRPLQWLATFVAFAGVMVMTFLNGKAVSWQPIVFALSASISWGAGTVVTQSLMRRHVGRIDTLALTAWQLFLGGVGYYVFFHGNASVVGQGIQMVIYAIIFCSIVVITGIAGEVSFAQATFAGIGGFASAQLSSSAGMSVIFTIIIGGLMAAVIGALLAVPALRLGGIFLTLATYAFALFFA